MNRFYPTEDKLKNPRDLQAMFKQVLDQHYALQDQFNAYKAANPPRSASAESSGNGPADTKILGLSIAPVDVQTLPNGATLKWNQAAGNFQFS